MKKIIRLTESDLARIVKRVIREQEEVTGGGGTNVSAGATLSNGLKILGNPKIRKSEYGTVVMLPTHSDGTYNEFACKRHENGKYILFPTGNGKYTLTKEESQALYDKYCK